MATQKQEKDLARVIKEITKNASDSKDESVKNAFKILNRTRKDVNAAVLDATTQGQITRLKQLDRAIDRATLDFGTKYKSLLSSDMEDLWEIGKELVDSPLDVMGVQAVIPELNTRALESAHNAMLRLVDRERKGLVAGLNKGIKQAIESGIAGLKTPFEIMQDVGKNLKDPGPFRSTAVRAEVTTRTELGHIQNRAASDRLKQAASRVPGMQHQWLWSSIGRVEHALANGQIRPAGVAFDVGGEKLLYPLDPNGSAENVIACGCTEVPQMKGWPSLKELNPQLVKKADKFTQPISEAIGHDDHMAYLPECYGELLIYKIAA